MLPKLVLSITSFIPLYLLMMIMFMHVYKNNTNCNYLIWCILIILTIQLICIIIVNKYISNKESLDLSQNEIKFINIKEDKKAHVDYMLTYLLPLLILDVSNVSIFNILYTNAFIICFILMNAKAENFNFNIVLYVKGYAVFNGEDIEGNTKILLIKKRKFSNIRLNNEQYKFVSFYSNDIYLCKKYIS